MSMTSTTDLTHRPDQRVLLHVGTPKSGTTFLQRALWRHREELEGLGVALAGTHHYDMFHAAIELRQSHDFWGRSPEQIDGTWQRLCDGAREFPGTTIMSHELLGAARREQIDRGLAALEGLEVHLVVTARDLARQVASDWQERVKNGNPVTFSAFCANVGLERHNGFWRNQHLIGVFDRWARAIPADRVHLVVGPPPGAAPDVLWHRFGDAVGFDATRIDPTAEEVSANQTLGSVQVAVLRRVNEELAGRIPQPAYSKVVKRAFAQSILAGQSSAPAQCPTDLVERLAEIATRQNSRVRRRGYQVHGDLAELVPTMPSGPWTDPDAVDPVLEAASAVAAICELLVDRAAYEAEPEPDPGLVPTARRVGGRLRRRLTRTPAKASP